MKSYTAEAIAELDEGAISPVLFVRVALDDRTDYYCTASASIHWDGQTWQGVGGAVSAGPITESDTLEAHGFKFIIGGLTQSDTAAFLTDETQGRLCTCWLGLIGEDGVVDSPAVEFEGRLDAATREIREDGSITITLPVESRMMRWNKAGGARFTHEEQQLILFGDTFFSRVAKLTESVETTWPKRTFFEK